jgi:hypothetical protein
MSSLRALLEDSIDYAGMFPPASLGLEEAAGNYCRYRREPEAWMLGSFVCQTARLAKLHPLVLDEIGRYESGEPEFRISTLMAGGDSLDSFIESTRRDEELYASGPRFSRVRSLEVRVPPELLAKADFRFLEHWLRIWLFPGDTAPRHVYLELPLQPPAELAGGLPTLIRRCAAEIRRRWRFNLHPYSYRIGVKLRTGGTMPDMAPSSAALAEAIVELSEQSLPWKATAGLHQPLRHFDAALGVKVHGFINLFAAAVMADVHRLPRAAVESILDDEDPGDFIFDETSMRWRDLSASVLQISQVRDGLLRSFGSCSFDEPRQGLKALGWL